MNGGSERTENGPTTSNTRTGNAAAILHIQSLILICVFCVVLQRSHFFRPSPFLPPLSLMKSKQHRLACVVSSVPGDGEFLCSLHALCLKHMHENAAAFRPALRLCVRASSQSGSAHLKDVLGPAKTPEGGGGLKSFI